ncbi:hypothetical protein J6590_017589 [Homalodisca vitripennis]|nr:hypothetical protein J6590_017589 [Homalodisca vitripennis]
MVILKLTLIECPFGIHSQSYIESTGIVKGLSALCCLKLFTIFLTNRSSTSDYGNCIIGQRSLRPPVPDVTKIVGEITSKCDNDITIRSTCDRCGITGIANLDVYSTQDSRITVIKRVNKNVNPVISLADESSRNTRARSRTTSWASDVTAGLGHVFRSSRLRSTSSAVIVWKCQVLLGGAAAGSDKKTRRVAAHTNTRARTHTRAHTAGSWEDAAHPAADARRLAHIKTKEQAGDQLTLESASRVEWQCGSSANSWRDVIALIPLLMLQHLISTNSEVRICYIPETR